MNRDLMALAIAAARLGVMTRRSSAACRVHGRPLALSLAGTPFCRDCQREAARTIPTVPRACVQSLREDSEVRERVVAE